MAYIGNTTTSIPFIADSFSGNASTTSFSPLSRAPAGTASIAVFVSGVYQPPSTYSLVGTAITFGSAPASGVGNITVLHLGNGSTTQVTSDGSVTLLKLSGDTYGYINTAFTAANTPSYTANSGASYANSAFTTANTAANNTTIASSYANSAFSVANNAVTSTNGTIAWATANSAASYANGSFTKANNALTAASNTATSVQLGSLGIGTAASGTTGEIRATNEVTAYYSSDARLKENIQTIENALDKLRQLNGVMFDWTDEVIMQRGGEDGYFVRKHDTGLIAQQVEEVLPEVVADRQDGYKAIKYEKMAGLIIQGINELSGEVKTIKERLARHGIT